MQRKKNPQADLRKYSSLMFAVGLCLVLFISWQAIEFKSYERRYDLESLNVDNDDDEEIPITEQIKTPPPPPKKQNLALAAAAEHQLPRGKKQDYRMT